MVTTTSFTGRLWTCLRAISFRERLNHTTEAVEIVLDRPGVEVLSGERQVGSVLVSAADVAIIRPVGE